MRWLDLTRRTGRAGCVAALLLATGMAAPQVDPKNPTCPTQPNWAGNQNMTFTLAEKGGKRVLLAEGRIDALAVDGLKAAMEANKPVDEIWFRSPGGNAQVGNEAGRYIRTLGIPTRIPNGWACFSACNFMFMGGIIRFVDPGGMFIVHMFTHLGDRAAVREELAKGDENAIEMIGDVEQGSAMLASDDNDFLIRMGVSRKLLTEVMYRQKAIEGQGTDKSTRRCLTQEELFKYNVANAR